MSQAQIELPLVAYKEWSVVCAALAAGAQSILVRKGGLHEGTAGFQVAHQRFWLYPTLFHQQPGLLLPGQEHWIEHASNFSRQADLVPLQLIATVTGVQHLSNVLELDQLEALTILSRATLEQRFYYRTPGLFVLQVQIEQQPAPVWFQETSAAAGCKTWVELDAKSLSEKTPR